MLGDSWRFTWDLLMTYFMEVFKMGWSVQSFQNTSRSFSFEGGRIAPPRLSGFVSGKWFGFMQVVSFRTSGFAVVSRHENRFVSLKWFHVTHVVSRHGSCHARGFTSWIMSRTWFHVMDFISQNVAKGVIFIRSKRDLFAQLKIIPNRISLDLCIKQGDSVV